MVYVYSRYQTQKPMQTKNLLHVLSVMRGMKSANYHHKLRVFMFKTQTTICKIIGSLDQNLAHAITFPTNFTFALFGSTRLSLCIKYVYIVLFNLFQVTRVPPQAPQVEQTVTTTTTTTTSVQPQTAARIFSQNHLPVILSEKTAEPQQQPQQQSQPQQQQQNIEDDCIKVIDVDANRKSAAEIALLCTSEPGRFIKRKQIDTKPSYENEASIKPETQSSVSNAESPASFVSTVSHQSDNNSLAVEVPDSKLKVQNIVSSQPTVVLHPLGLGGRASIRLQSLEEERLKEGEKVAVPSDLNKPDNQANVNCTKPQGSERKRHRSACEVEASGQVFLTASPRKQPKKSTSSEPEPVHSHSETSKSDKNLLPVTVTDPQSTEGVSPKERSRSPETEKGSTVMQQHQDSNFNGSSSFSGKYKSSKGRSKQRSADLEAHSPEKPELKLLIRSKSTATTWEFTSSVVDPYKFDDSEEGGSCSGETRSQKRKASDNNDVESDGSHGSGDHIKEAKQGQSPKKLKLPR